MKVVFTKDTELHDDDSLIIHDINMVDLLIDDAEAVEIIVDDFLSSFTYKEAGNILNIILSKLRMGGKIIVIFTDGELEAHRLNRGFITLEEFNYKLFNNRAQSVLSVDIVKDLLTNFGLKIISTKIVSENGTCVIIGERA